MPALPVAPAASGRHVDAPLATVPKPEGFGPFPVGSYTDALTTSTKSYKTNVIVFYPAQANGSGADANKTKAPYPTIVLLPFFGGDQVAMSGLAQQISSWGLVVMSVGVNWTDFPDSANVSDMEEFLDYLEAQNTTPAASLYQMVDKEAFGLSGYSSGGGLSVIDTAYVDRIKAMETLAAAINAGTVDMIAPDFHKPVLLQVGKDDSTYKGGSEEAYKVFKVQRSLVEILGAGHGGPFETYLFPAFYLYIFNRVPAYRTFIYGEEAVKDHMTGIYDLQFNVSPTDFFPPYAKATTSKSSVNMDEALNFNATFVGYWPKGMAQNNFQWDIDGDGTWDITDNVSVNGTTVFKAPGTYNPKFTYSAGRLAISAVAAPVSVKNIPPMAVAGNDTTTVEDLLTNFDGSLSTDTESDVLVYRWSFGDGGTRDFDANPMADHIYKKSGSYAATMTVKDLFGATATDQLSVTVKNLAPKAEAGTTLKGLEDEPVDLVGNGTDTPSDRPALVFKWDFGDGNVTDWVQGQTATHIYTRTGNYSAIFSVKDDNGAVATDTVRVEISDISPLATITAPDNGTTVEEDTVVELKGMGQDTVSDQADLEYMWDFGDGTSTVWGLSADTTHVYKTPGKFGITLWVSDHDGLMANTTTQIVVINPLPEAKVISPSNGVQVAEDQMVTFVGDGLDNPSDMSGLTYEWTIEGTVFKGKEVQYGFTKTGTYDISIKVTDPHGASANATVQVRVTNPAPTLASVIVEPLTFKVGGYINYSAEGYDTSSDKAGLSYQWTFGDGFKANDSGGVHTYGVEGTYTVKVVVTDDEGASVSKTFTLVVEAVKKPKPHNNGTQGPGVMVYAAVIAVVVAAVLIALIVMKGGVRGSKEEKIIEEKEADEEESPKEEKIKEEEKDDDEVT
jgi:dienelactone hydrolase